MLPTFEAQVLHATTSLIHDLANAGSYPVSAHSDRGSKHLAPLLLSISTLLVRDDEFVTTAARLSSRSEKIVELELLISSQAVDTEHTWFTPPSGSFPTFRDVLEIHARNLGFCEYGHVVQSFLQAYIWNAWDEDKAMDIKVVFSACIFLNSVSVLIHKMDMHSRNIDMLMDVLAKDFVPLEEITHPQLAFAADITLLQLLTSELWTTSAGEFTPHLLEDLSVYCTEGNVAPDYHLWTMSHWQQFAKCVYLLFSRLHESLLMMADLSTLTRSQSINDDLTRRLGQTYEQLESDYRIVQQLHKSASFYNLLLMLESTLAQGFTDPSPPPCHSQPSMEDLDELPRSQSQTYLTFYRSWLKTQIAHLQACDIVDRYHAYFRKFMPLDIPQSLEVKLIFRYLPVPSLSSVSIAEWPDINRDAFMQYLFDHQPGDFSAMWVLESVKGLPRCYASHELIHPAICLAITISHYVEGIFSSNYYQEIGASSYCCNHCCTCLSRMGFQFNTDIQPDSFPLSLLLPPISLSSLAPRPIVGVLIQHLVAPLKLHLAEVVNRHRLLTTSTVAVDPDGVNNGGSSNSGMA